MTVHTNNVTFWQSPHAGMIRIWADDEAELFEAGLAVGADLTQFEDTGSFPCFFLTPDQHALAVFNGAVVTDWLGPREWRARRERDVEALSWIEDARRRGAKAAA